MPSPPRRSTRGAAPAAPASTTSSSLSSSRQDRTSRGGVQKSTTPRSLSSEDISEPPRRSQRAQPTHKDTDLAKADEAVEDGDEEAIDEEEITRCICEQQEYPGLPLIEVFATVEDAQIEDAGGLFILCDGCSVWQHGGCVGILEDSQVPDKYFCEQCRPKLHAISTDNRGQKFSLYLPLHPKASQRKGSVSKHDEKAKKERESIVSRASVDPATGKRRATMRSKEHDDEEEQIRIAIEESKRDVQSKAGNGRRSAKRGRDDSSEDSSSKQESKRQRRSSELAPLINRTASIDEDSDDQLPTASKAKKAKLEANLTARQAELDKKEKEREMARVEAAGRRQERARSRRNDDVDAADDTTPKPTPSAKPSPPPPSSQPPSPPPAEKVTVKKGPGKKPGKKLGNNQYTKAKLEAAAAAASSPHGRKKVQNQVPGSGDEASEGQANGETNGNSKNSPGAPENGAGTIKGKFGRGKKAAVGGSNGEPPERTFTNMHAALVNMGAFVDKHKTELDLLRANSEGSPRSTPSDVLMLGGAVQPPGGDTPQQPDERPDDELSAYEMGLKLQRGIEAWQREWGHLAGTNSASAGA